MCRKAAAAAAAAPKKLYTPSHHIGPSVQLSHIIYARFIYLSVPLPSTSLFRGYCTFSDSLRTINSSTVRSPINHFIPLCVSSILIDAIKYFWIEHVLYSRPSWMKPLLLKITKLNQLNHKFKTWINFQSGRRWQGAKTAQLIF